MKLIVIGLDGATWDVLYALIEKGYMPTLQKMVKNGISGILESIVPPVTGPSWVSFATGRNPAKTGVFDFLIRETNSYRLKPVSSAQFKGKSFWDYLSSLGYQVGLVAFPMLYPPYDIHGFMISGVGAPSKSNKCFPRDLEEEINREIGEYEVSVDYHDPKYDDEELFLKDLGTFVEKHRRMIKYLLRNKGWDLFVYIFSATDWIQHLFWKHIDENHPLHDLNRSPSLRRRFAEFFQQVDSLLSEVISLAGSEANILILSDHGFGIQDQSFNLVKWLKKKGYLKISIVNRIKIDIKKYALKLLVFVNKVLRIKKLFPTKIVKDVTDVLSTETEIVDMIDFSKSKAYCLGHTIPFGAIYINLKGRDPRGIVDLEDYSKLKTQIINELYKLSEEIGESLSIKVYDLQKMYNMPENTLGPDIIFTINNWRCVIIKDDFSRPLFEKKSFSNRHTGAHRLEGIFVAFGPEFEKGKKIEKVRIIDIAPTILHMFNAPIPKDMDGRVLTEIFKPESEAAKRKPRYINESFKEQTKTKIEKMHSKSAQLKLRKR